MQLKRETDYALRIVFYIGEQWAEKGRSSCGFDLSELSMQAGVPRLAAGRVCGYLENGGIIVSYRADSGELRWRPCEGFYGRTMLDIIEAVEGQVQLFAVFDRKNRFFGMYGAKLRRLQSRFCAVFSEFSVEELLKVRKKPEKRKKRW